VSVYEASAVRGGNQARHVAHVVDKPVLNAIYRQVLQKEKKGISGGCHVMRRGDICPRNIR